MAGAILKITTIKQKTEDFKKHSPIVLLTPKALYCHQYSTDFIYFVPLARELFLHSWLTLRENGPTSTWFVLLRKLLRFNFCFYGRLATPYVHEF